MATERVLQIIAKHEGFRSKPYLCPANKWTIGHGLTYYPDTGFKVRQTDKPITKERSFELVSIIVDQTIDLIRNMTPGVDLEQNQIDALVSFIFNIGIKNFQSSTLLKKVKLDPNDDSIRIEFMKWNKVTVVENGVTKKVVSNGLSKRRKEEADLYFS